MPFPYRVLNSTGDLRTFVPDHLSSPAALSCHLELCRLALCRTLLAFFRRNAGLPNMSLRRRFWLLLQRLFNDLQSIPDQNRGAVSRQLSLLGYDAEAPGGM